MNKRKIWKSALLLVLVFLAGGVTGSVVTNYVGKIMLARAFDFNRWPDTLVSVLGEKMELSADQKQKIHAIGEDLAKQIKATLDKAVNDSGHIIVATQHRVDEVLTPDQRKIHAQMKEEFRQHLKDDLGFTLPEE